MSVWRASFMEGLRPERALTVSEWADEHRTVEQQGISGAWTMADGKDSLLAGADGLA
jgi:hypothetical protein